MTDEQLSRVVGDIRVSTAETRMRVRQIQRAQKETSEEVKTLRDRVDVIDRWRYTVAGGWIVVAAGVQLLVQWVLR